MDNFTKSVGVVVIKDNKVLLGRHAYGAGKGLLIVPGGFLKDKEMAEDAVVRETLEETGVLVRPTGVVAIRFNPECWYCLFRAEYVEQVTYDTDGENTEVLWVPLEEVPLRDDIPMLSKSAIEAALTQRGLEWATEKAASERKPFTFYA